MIIFVIILFIIVVNIILPPPSDLINRKEDRCPPHKYIYNKNNELECEICKWIPGKNYDSRV